MLFLTAQLIPKSFYRQSELNFHYE